MASPPGLGNIRCQRREIRLLAQAVQVHPLQLAEIGGHADILLKREGGAAVELRLPAANQAQWETFCAVAGLPELLGDPRFATVALRVGNYEALRARLDAEFRKKPVAHWLLLLRGAGLPCGEVRTVPQALADPQLAARGMILELEHPKAGRIRQTASPLKLSAAGASRASAPPLLEG